MRVILIPLLLLSVLTIGLPVDNLPGELSYKLLRRFGLDVSMTPITFDMSMMTDEKGNLVYEKFFTIKLFFGDGTEMALDAGKLDFYRHKVPFNLYYEILGNDGLIPEGKVFLCNSLQEFSTKALSGFMISLSKKEQISRGFNELQICP